MRISLVRAGSLVLSPISQATPALLGVMVLQGCGGSIAGVGTAARVTSIVDSVRFTGFPKSALITGPNSISIVACYGAKFTSLSLAPAAKLSDTYLLTSLERVGYSVELQRTPSWDSASFSPVLDIENQSENYSPGFTPDGRILYSAFDSKSQVQQIYTCFPDGTGVTQLTNYTNGQLVGGASFPAMSPDGTRVAFNDANGSLYRAVLGSNGLLGPPIHITTQYGTGWTPAWSPDGKWIAFQSGALIFKIPYNGGATVQVSPNQGFSPSWSPDGRSITYSSGTQTVFQAIAGNVFVVDANNMNNYVQIPSPTNCDVAPVFSPDGKTVAFWRADKAGDASSYQIVLSSYGGRVQTTFPMKAPTTANFLYLAWSPFLQPKAFIGGVLSATASGFMFTQNGDNFASILSFTVTTPSKAYCVLKSNSQSGGDMVFDVGGDNVQSLSFMNTYTGRPTTISPNQSDVLVSVSATTGQVTTLAPYSSTLARVRGQDGDTWDGAFSAVYDAQGRNLAPQGASQLHLNGSENQVRVD